MPTCLAHLGVGVSHYGKGQLLLCRGLELDILCHACGGSLIWGVAAAVGAQGSMCD